MSVTFLINGESPTEKVYIKDLYPGLTEEEYADEYPHYPGSGRDENGYYEMRDTWPELNVSNANSSIVLRMMGLGARIDYCGTIEPHEYADIRRNLIVYLNSEKKRDQHCRESYTEGNFTDCGVVDEQVLRYATRMLEVLDVAQANNCNINWG